MAKRLLRYELVGLDDFEEPGEGHYVISRHATLLSATAAWKAYLKSKENNGDEIFIYDNDMKIAVATRTRRR